MPVHIDQPAPGMTFDPAGFVIRGWLWLEAQHPLLAAVEAWSGDLLLGEASAATFFSRPDVAAKYALPAGTLTAFEFPARHPTAVPGEPFDLELRVRLRDGTTTAPIFASRVGPLPLERDPQALLRARLAPDALGLEIGAHTRPTPGLAPFHTDAVPAYVGASGRVDFLSDARALPLADATLDYLCASHVLEHLPDPLAALHEWHRVLRPGGWLYLVVPDKRFTFDEPRAVTTPEHLLADFVAASTAATSVEHVDEFVFHTHWEHLRPGVPDAERPAQQAAARADYLARLARGETVDIHFHTFTPESLEDTLRRAGFVGGESARFAVAARAERYPPERTDGIALLLRKTGAAPAARVLSAASATVLPHPQRPALTLPLVDPVTLSPVAALLPADCPDLLPPPGATPRRPWSRRWWRVLALRRTALRLAFSGEPR